MTRSNPKDREANDPAFGDWRHVLRDRAVPDGTLDDLVSAVRRQVSEPDGVNDAADGWRRAGLSNAFLDAPRQLVVWRRMAVAALVMLGVGAGAWMQGMLRWEGGDAPTARFADGVDPRSTLLPPDDRRAPLPRAVRARAARWRATPPVMNHPVRMVSDGRPDVMGGVDSTVVFPLRNLNSPNVSNMLDGLAIPDMGARVIEHN